MVAIARFFAEAGTDATDDHGKRNLVVNQVKGLFVMTLDDAVHVSADIHMRRAGVLAGRDQEPRRRSVEKSFRPLDASYRFIAFIGLAAITAGCTHYNCVFTILPGFNGPVGITQEGAGHADDISPFLV